MMPENSQLETTTDEEDIAVAIVAAGHDEV